MSSTEFTRDDLRHLLRRLHFAATPELETRASARDHEAAFAALWAESSTAPQPPPPEFLREPWTNSALAYAGLAPAARETARTEQLAAQRRDTEFLRHEWLARMIDGPGLRESLTFFLHSLFGSSSEAVEIPQALYGRTALLRRVCMTSVPEILAELVLDPAMLIQIGMENHGPDRVSDRPAKLILEHWTVGPGAYDDADVGELSRALTGWSLGAPNGPAAQELDTKAPTALRRTGLVPQFDPARHERGPKTILGTTSDFDARTALQFLALQPATARHFGRALLRHFGVADPEGALLRRLETVFLSSAGSMHELVRTIVVEPELWADASRWTLIKSPVHLAVGACRQLALDEPPVAALSGWLTACGQTLFDTPNNGEGGWPDREAWITPADRLLLRYRLPNVLAGEPFDSGAAGRALASSPASGHPPAPSVSSFDELIDRLDPAPGLKLEAPPRRNHTWANIELIMATPQYQLA